MEAIEATSQDPTTEQAGLKQGALLQVPLNWCMVVTASIPPIDKRKSKRVFPWRKALPFLITPIGGERTAGELEERGIWGNPRDILRPRSKEYTLHLLKD